MWKTSTKRSKSLRLPLTRTLSALDRLGRAELAGEQGMEGHVGLEDEVCVRQRAFVDLERAVVDPCVDDDLAEAELVAGLQVSSGLGSEGRAQCEKQRVRRHDVVGSRLRHRLRPPEPEPEDDVLELAPVLGELVAHSARRPRQHLATHDPFVLELLQPRREDVRGDPRLAALQVGEALGAAEQVAHEHERPALADELERMGEPAVLSVAARLHALNIAHLRRPR